MRNVQCEQLRYTWAEQRLDGRGAGFGIVVCSRNWPKGLLEQPGIRQLVTDLSSAARRVPPDGGAVFVAHRRLGEGSLLVAKRPVGTDGAGRPENYSVHALYDPTATLGALDLTALVRGGTFRLERDVHVVPDGDADPVDVYVPDSWQIQPPFAPDADGGWSEPPVRCWDLDELETVLRRMCASMPADLVNQVDVDCGHDGRRIGTASPAEANPGTRFADAVALGADREDFWWARRGWDPTAWSVTSDRFVVLNQSLADVPDRWLPQRWEQAPPRGRRRVITELLARPALTSDAELVQAVAARPEMLDDIAEVGLRGRKQQLATASQWVATAGSEEQVVALAAELAVSQPDPALPTDLVERLRQHHPDQLPPVLQGVVADTLDGTQPMSAAWRSVCLHRLLAGQPSCSNPDSLGAACTDGELDQVLAEAAGDGTDLDEKWRRLGGVVSPARRDGAFARASEMTAGYLLQHGLAVRPWPGAAGPRSGNQPTRRSWDRVARRVTARRLAAVWPELVATLGWSEAVRGTLPELVRRQRLLRLQRSILMTVVAILVIVVAVLAIG